MLYIQEPLIKPVSLWTPPSYYPDIPDVFGFDCETKDPDLSERGPSSFRGGGYAVGVSIAFEQDGYMQHFYFPWAHQGGDNLDKGFIFRWLKPILEDPNKLLIGSNVLYELEWMSFEGIDIKCKFWDVQTVDALLYEERRSHSLEACMIQHLGYGKNEEKLKEAASCYGFNAKNDLWRLPARFVGEYASTDASAPLEIYKKQKPLIEAQGLGAVLQMEMDLIPVIWAMRKKGVRVDMDTAEQVYKEWSAKEKSLYEKLQVDYGVNLDSVWANEQIAAGANSLNISYPRTQAGAPSFVDAWLSSQDHAYWKAISDIRGVNKLNDTFIRQSILENAVKGRIHCQFHPMLRDEGGTRSGRLSCSNPNLQQVPNHEHSPDAWKVRAIFVPEEGEQWGKLDYSQQEPRLAVHYGCLEKFRGADAARREYTNNAGADFYNILVKLANVTRSEAKKLYLGRSYGMGKVKLARTLGLSLEESEALADKMDNQVPFIKELYYDTMRKANQRGFIRTISGRRAHFDKWEPAKWNDTGNPYGPLGLESAKRQWPNQELKRSGTHKAMNRLIQGGAADMTKLAMLEMYRQGIVPLLQVHDEIDISFSEPKLAQQCKEIMENAVKLVLPVYADLKVGPNWGEAE